LITIAPKETIEPLKCFQLRRMLYFCLMEVRRDSDHKRQ